MDRQLGSEVSPSENAKSMTGFSIDFTLDTLSAEQELQEDIRKLILVSRQVLFELREDHVRIENVNPTAYLHFKLRQDFPNLCSPFMDVTQLRQVSRQGKLKFLYKDALHMTTLTNLPLTPQDNKQTKPTKAGVVKTKDAVTHYKLAPYSQSMVIRLNAVIENLLQMGHTSNSEVLRGIQYILQRPIFGVMMQGGLGDDEHMTEEKKNSLQVTVTLHFYANNLLHFLMVMRNNLLDYAVGGYGEIPAHLTVLYSMLLEIMGILQPQRNLYLPPVVQKSKPELGRSASAVVMITPEPSPAPPAKSYGRT